MVAAALDHERAWVDGLRVDLHEEMAALTLDVVGRTLFGADLRAQTQEVADALAVVMGSFRRRMARGPGGVLDRLPTTANRRTADGLARLDAVVADLVARHRAGSGGPASRARSATTCCRCSWRPATMEGDGSGMSDQQVRDEVMTLVLAGHETTANALDWAWFLLGRDAVDAGARARRGRRGRTP